MTVQAQTLLESDNFGPFYNSGQQLTFADYNPVANGNVPLTSLYVYLSAYDTGSGVFQGTGGTPSITVSENVSLSNVGTLAETVVASYSETSPLSAGQNENFSFAGTTMTVYEIDTSNLANYTGGGSFTINVSDNVQSVNVTGGNYDQNNSTFPVDGTVQVSFNGPKPVVVPESSLWWMVLPLALLVSLRRRLEGRHRLSV